MFTQQTRLSCHKRVPVGVSLAPGSDTRRVLYDDDDGISTESGSSICVRRGPLDGPDSFVSAAAHTCLYRGGRMLKGFSRMLKCKVM